MDTTESPFGGLADRLAAVEARLETDARESDERVAANEIALLEQEHRLIPAVRNYLKHRSRGRGDKRYQAAAVALAWRLFVRGAATAAIGAGAIVGLLTVFAAGAQAWLLLRQNSLISDQNRYFQEQTKEVRELTEQQIDEARLARRSQLLGTIYDRVQCDKEDQKDCPHSASRRARRDAAEALVQMAGPKGWAQLFGVDFRGEELLGVNLRRANLSGANLQHAYLQGAEFSGANLRDANLRRANLSGANLQYAYLQGAGLQGVNLNGAYLQYAYLQDTNLKKAKLAAAYLQGANLQDANLQDADLGHARNLIQLQIDVARGSVKTTLPPGLTHPCWWEGVECDGKIGDGTPPEGWPDNLPED